MSGAHKLQWAAFMVVVAQHAAPLQTSSALALLFVFLRAQDNID